MLTWCTTISRRLAIVGLLGLGAWTSDAKAQGVVPVPTQDVAMAAAIARAQASLPGFFVRLEKPEAGDEGFAVKIRFPTKGTNAEHIWANNVQLKGDQVSAVINNVPRDIPNLKVGQRVTVPVAQITDWMFMRDDKIHGGETIWAVLPHMPAEQAAAMKARLAPR
jgi:uncharacterized protein YegJ (DUF2314 family)